ncbi:MAG: YifB family Mg chelatase-like AAA ATPase [Lentisphaeria bacterium]
MIVQTLSAAISGVEACSVNIEVNVTPCEQQKTIVNIIGLPDAAIRESRDRVWSAVLFCKCYIPRGRVTINLAPADLRKSGAAFDLAIALCIICMDRKLPPESLKNTMIVGELGLNGEIRPVRGILPMAVHAKRIGIKRMLVPLANTEEAAVIEGLEVYGMTHLIQVIQFLNKQLEVPRAVVDIQALYQRGQGTCPDFLDVKGQESAKRALLIAVSGNHNILMIGQPGVGKSLIANRIPGIMPTLNLNEAIEVTKIHSIAGELPVGGGLIVTRPFRSPHHTVSGAGLLGGGKNIPHPGEISLAHRGVLFLDELPEFKRDVLEALRQPMENGVVNIARASGNYTFPADFMLVAAMNPCPCGYYGSHPNRCSCSWQAVKMYRSRISGPLLDRMDLHIELQPLSREQLTGKRAGETSASIRQKVMACRKIQDQRFEHTNIRSNAAISGKDLDQFCALDQEGKDFINKAMNSLRLSARSYDRILRVSRTIADLEGDANINAAHLSEAMNYRCMDQENTNRNRERW